MAMLAEPRQRKRYNLVPRGKALFEDDNRFGTKMLQKMGWSKGKGLGANEDGSKDFVRVRYKNDANGLGYEERDDQWTQHEESFNGLLKSLHGDEECANDANNLDDDNEDAITTVGFGFQSEPKKKLKLKEKFSGESLEEKSKKSKARVHYKKFTRGKDLSRYSEKDLANIFGKKDVEEQAANAIYEQFSAFTMNNEEGEEEKEVETNLAGVPTINTGLSVSDYFKQKMEAMKNKTKRTFHENESKILIDTIEDESSECGQDSKKKKKKQKRASNEQVEEITDAENCTTSKKKRKQVDMEESLKIIAENETKTLVTEAIEDESLECSQETKNKKKKQKRASTEQAEETVETENFTATKKKRKQIVEDKSLLLNTQQTESFQEETKNETVDSKEKAKQAKESIVAENKTACKTKRKQIVEDKSLLLNTQQTETLQEETKNETVDSKKKAKEEKRKAKKIKQNSQVEDVATNEEEFIGEAQQNEKNSDSCAVETTTTEEVGKKKSKKIPAENMALDELLIDETITKISKKSKKKNKETSASAQSSIEPTHHQLENSKECATDNTHNLDVQDTSELVPTHNIILTSSNKSREVSVFHKKYCEENLTLEALKAELNSHNIYTISTFCAEKFRNADLTCFTGSSLAAIVGYSLSDKLQLEIVEIRSDLERITKLWNGESIKYTNYKNMSNYNKYRRQAQKVRKIKKKLPRINIKKYKQNDAFTGIFQFK